MVREGEGKERKGREEKGRVREDEGMGIKGVKG
jgi:hypothetical protein